MVGSIRIHAALKEFSHNDSLSPINGIGDRSLLVGGTPTNHKNGGPEFPCHYGTAKRCTHDK